MAKQELLKDLPASAADQGIVKSLAERMLNIVKEKATLDEDLKELKEEVKETGVCPTWLLGVVNAQYDSLYNADKKNESAREKVVVISQAEEVFG